MTPTLNSHHPSLLLTLAILLLAAPSATAQPTPDDPNQPPVQPPANAQSPESSPREQLQRIYDQIPGLESIEVTVTAGVVTLNGEVDDPTARDTAEQIAADIDGTIHVQNNLSVTTEVTERVSPALARAWDKLRELVGFLPLLVVGLLVLIVFWWAARWIGNLDLPGTRLDERPFVQNIIRQIVSFVVFLVGVLFVLDLFGVTTLVGAVLGTAGVAGLALGFAFRDIAENYLASIILGVQQPFRKNDYIKVEQYEGKVIRMTPRETVLMTLSGNHVRIPNATVFKSPTYNVTRNPMRRFEFSVGIGVDEEMAQAQQVGIDVLQQMTGVADDPEPVARVEQLADSTVQLTFLGWVDQQEYDWFKVKSEALRRVKNGLDAAGIEMPEPIYRVLNADYQPDDHHADRQQRAQQALEQPGLEVEPSPDIDEQIDQDRAESNETDLLQE